MTQTVFTDRDILLPRPAKNPVDPNRPYGFFVEQEHTETGRIEDVATILLVNRECPFRCLMCDLWKNTTDTRVPRGAIPRQIDFALERLPSAQHVKLYNSGNFSDPQAIPPEDHAAIADRMRPFSTVVVENHPRLCGDDCLRFRDLLDGELEVAMGLETAQPETLARLHKQMTLADFERAVGFLLEHAIQVRAFILLQPPFMAEADAVTWAVRSIQFAFDTGVRCCSVVPTRAGNGIMDRVQAAGDFSPPSLAAMEAVLEAGLRLGRGRVFMDLWDLERFDTCPRCGPLRAERMQRMNWTQELVPRISRDCGCSS
jgi:radical SAM enzyme (TIGR01210 family)